METEAEVWKPEIGKPAWVVDPRHFRVIEIEVVDILYAKPLLSGDVDVVKISHPSSYGSWSEGWHKCYPTPAAAAATLEIVYLDGREVSNEQ